MGKLKILLRVETGKDLNGRQGIGGSYKEWGSESQRDKETESYKFIWALDFEFI